jgi:UDP-glucose 4-epimerase
VTKLAAELLARAYADNWGINVVSLRYFSVYGPRQRPDMAFSKMLQAVKTGEPFTIFGRSKVRDFTFVGDVVNANISAANSDVQPGSVYNIGGGSAVDLNHAIEVIEEILGRPIPTVMGSDPVGDVGRTGADITRARRDLAWQPNTSLVDGLRAQVGWQLQQDLGGSKQD